MKLYKYNYCRFDLFLKKGLVLQECMGLNGIGYVLNNYFLLMQYFLNIYIPILYLSYYIQFLIRTNSTKDSESPAFYPIKALDQII